jgi:hypothetical protein
VAQESGDHRRGGGVGSPGGSTPGVDGERRTVDTAGWHSDRDVARHPGSPYGDVSRQLRLLGGGVGDNRRGRRRRVLQLGRRGGVHLREGRLGLADDADRHLNDPAAANDYFGSSVAVSGKTVVVGALGTNSGAGAAYIYVKAASGWPTTPTATLNDPAATSDDHFGYSVAVSGKTAVVGAPGTNSFAGTAYIYQA